MQVLLVYAHPNTCSFNQALKTHLTQILTNSQNRHELIFSDLYAEHFKAVADWQDFTTINMPQQYSLAQQQACTQDSFSLDIKNEQTKLLQAEFIIIQFPLWWFSMPAILKGWFDRILAAGFAYKKDQWFETGLLRSRKVMLAITTQSPANAYTSGGMHGDITQYLLPINHTLRFAGLAVMPPYIAYDVMATTDVVRQKFLTAYADAVLANLSKIP